MDAADLRASIQNIIATEGFKPQTAMCVADSSSAYLPTMEIGGDNNTVVVQKKLDALKLSKLQAPESQSHTLNLDGGIRGLVDRADTIRDDNHLSREEIVARLGTKLSQDEQMALKDLYRNFSSIDRNHDGRLSRGDIQTRQDRERSQEQLDGRLDEFRGAVARNRHIIDSNKDGQLSTQEMRTASRPSSGVSDADRRSIEWGRARS